MRTRRHIQKFYQMRTQLQAVSLRIQTLRSNQQMGEAMKGATRAMGLMNRSMNLPQVQKIMKEFERETEVMDMKEEMMSDAVDEAMEDDAEGVGEEEEGDAILKEVLDSIGVDLSQNVSPPSGVGSKTLSRHAASQAASHNRSHIHLLFETPHSSPKHRQQSSMFSPLYRREWPLARRWALAEADQ